MAFIGAYLSEPDRQTPGGTGGESSSGRVLSNCPGYQESGIQGTLDININVPRGYIAFIDAQTLDGVRGSVFAEITGPYLGRHQIGNGAYCYDIRSTDNYTLVKQQRIGQVPKPYSTLYLPRP